MYILPIHPINPSSSPYRQKEQPKDSSSFRQILQKAKENEKHNNPFQHKMDATLQPIKK